MKIYIHTLGCKVNQFESQAMETVFTQRGHEMTDDITSADAVIVNTCAVTSEGVRKARQAIRRFKGENEKALLAVCGCFPQTEPKEALKTGADVIFGSGERMEFINAVENAYKTGEKTVRIDEAFKRKCFERLPAGTLSTRTRALLKIEDGCVNFCSYCVIPYARGAIRSLPVKDAVEEALSLKSRGFREIVLTGIEIASYGKDLKDGTELTDVVTAIAEAVPDVRIRLGSLEPRIITRELLDKFIKHDNICPHFHLSLQSGCDETLKRMNRKYDTARFYESVSLLREYYPDCAITSDLIVGFPGETEEEFSETLSFIDKCAFSAMHIFPYSVRHGTVAEKLPDRIETREKHLRAKRASEIAEKNKTAFLNAQIGKTLTVLFEHESGGVWTGHTANYIPVSVKGENLKNVLGNVHIIRAKSDMLLGEMRL